MSKPGLPGTRLTQGPEKLLEQGHDTIRYRKNLCLGDLYLPIERVWARRPRRLPTALTKEELRHVIPASWPHHTATAFLTQRSKKAMATAFGVSDHQMQSLRESITRRR